MLLPLSVLQLVPLSHCSQQDLILGSMIDLVEKLLAFDNRCEEVP